MELKRTFVTAAALGAVVTLGACKRAENANADTPMGAMTSTDSAMQAGVGDTTGMNSPTLTDAEIFAVLDEINEGEVELGKTARDKATNADVKAFARDMVAAHEKMEDEGEALAKRLNISPKQEASDSLKAANEMMDDRLEALAKGPSFDTAYVNSQVMGHEAAVAFLAKAKDQATSAELKAMIDSAAPNVQKHLDRARELQTKVTK